MIENNLGKDLTAPFLRPFVPVDVGLGLFRLVPPRGVEAVAGRVSDVTPPEA